MSTAWGAGARVDVFFDIVLRSRRESPSAMQRVGYPFDPTRSIGWGDGGG